LAKTNLQGKARLHFLWGVLSANRWECGWGVWCNRPTVFAACLYNLPHPFRQNNQKMRIRLSFPVKLSDFFQPLLHHP